MAEEMGKREGTGKVLIMQPQFWCPIRYKIFSCVQASLWCGVVWCGGNDSGPQLMCKKAWCVWACDGGACGIAFSIRSS